MASERYFLGSIASLGRIAYTGEVIIDVKPEVRQAVKDTLLFSLEQNDLRPGKAGKIRGKLTWCDTNSSGKIGRLGTYQLKKRQYGINGDTGPDPDADMRDGVKFLVKLMDLVQPRTTTILGACKMPVVAYSDASFPTIFLTRRRGLIRQDLVG